MIPLAPTPTAVRRTYSCYRAENPTFYSFKRIMSLYIPRTFAHYHSCLVKGPEAALI